MPEFTYVARELSGKQTTGLVTAQSQQEALNQLSSRQLFPLKIEMAEASKLQQKNVARRVRPRHLSVFYSQLADLLKSGVPLLKSLELLERQSNSPALTAVLSEIRAEAVSYTHLTLPTNREV